MTKTMTTIGKEILETIEAVLVESTGRIECDHDEAQQFAEQWLWEQERIEVEAEVIADLMDQCELTELEAKRTAAVDAAHLAWMESREWTPDNVSFSPLPDFVK